MTRTTPPADNDADHGTEETCERCTGSGCSNVAATLTLTVRIDVRRAAGPARPTANILWALQDAIASTEEIPVDSATRYAIEHVDYRNPRTAPVTDEQTADTGEFAAAIALDFGPTSIETALRTLAELWLGHDPHDDLSQHQQAVAQRLADLQQAHGTAEEDQIVTQFERTPNIDPDRYRWNDHSNGLGDWCPWSSTPATNTSVDHRCPAGCPSSTPEPDDHEHQDHEQDHEADQADPTACQLCGAPGGFPYCTGRFGGNASCADVVEIDGVPGTDH